MFTVSFVIVGVLDAPGPVYKGVADVIFPVVPVFVLKVSGVKSEIRVMRPEKRSAILLCTVVPEGEGMAVLRYRGPDIAAPGPSFMLNFRRYGIGGRGGRQYVGYKAFVIPPYGMAHCPAVVGRPVPVKHVFAIAGVPVPLYLSPQGVDPGCKILFFFFTFK